MLQINQDMPADRIYIGGGNAEKIDFKLPKNAHIISNAEGLYGVMALWR